MAIDRFPDPISGMDVTFDPPVPAPRNFIPNTLGDIFGAAVANNRHDQCLIGSVAAINFDRAYEASPIGNQEMSIAAFALQHHVVKFVPVHVNA